MNHHTISEAVTRIQTGTATREDLESLAHAVQAGQVRVVSGERATAIGRDATDAVIVTGNDNIVVHGSTLKSLQGLKGSDAHGSGSAPPMPNLVTGRDEDLQDIKGRLGIVPGHRHSPRLVIMRGWPGVGKTTLAAALAHDIETTLAFPDGILWVSLDQTPNLLSELAAWGRALGDERIARSTTLDEAKGQLTALLRDKRMLLIIDDVWESHHALPFLVGGRDCATLITTREQQVANELAPTPSHIKLLRELTEPKALELLERLATSVVSEYPEEARQLVIELECLPLALQVAGRLLNTDASYGFGVEELLVELREGAKVLAATPPADRTDVARETRPTVAVLFKKSTDRLNQETREYYAYLGVFAPKPATFSLKHMQRVWRVDDARPIVRTLVDRGLLEPVSGRFQMHALLVAHAKSLLAEADQ